jgi:hypothetical protein
MPAASMPAAGMGWDPLQRAVLAELGLPVLAAALPEHPMGVVLLRAAGRDRASVDAAALLRGFPPASALRGDAAAKRALWPSLRRLRRAARAG